MILEKCSISGFADEIDSSLEKQLQVLNNLGIHYMEIRGVNGKNILDHSLDEVREIKKQLDAAGVKVSSVGSPIGKIQITAKPKMAIYFTTFFTFFIPIPSLVFLASAADLCLNNG